MTDPEPAVTDAPPDERLRQNRETAQQFLDDAGEAFSETAPGTPVRVDLGSYESELFDHPDQEDDGAQSQGLQPQDHAEGPAQAGEGPPAEEGGPEGPEVEPEPAVPEGAVAFQCLRYPSLIVHGPHGRVGQFARGVLVVDDPAAIDYLDSGAIPEVSRLASQGAAHARPPQ